MTPPPLTPPDTSAAPWLGIAVRVVIRNPSGHLLLVRRPGGGSSPHQWEFPGGKLDPGELPVEGALRETREETGIEVEITGLLGATEGRHMGGRTINLAFHASPLTHDIALSPEHASHTWTRPADIPRLSLTPDTQSLLGLLARHQTGHSAAPSAYI